MIDHSRNGTSEQRRAFFGARSFGKARLLPSLCVSGLLRLGGALPSRNLDAPSSFPHLERFASMDCEI